MWPIFYLKEGRRKADAILKNRRFFQSSRNANFFVLKEGRREADAILKNRRFFQSSRNANFFIIGGN